MLCGESKAIPYQLPQPSEVADCESHCVPAFNENRQSSVIPFSPSLGPLRAKPSPKPFLSQPTRSQKSPVSSCNGDRRPRSCTSKGTTFWTSCHGTTSAFAWSAPWRSWIWIRTTLKRNSGIGKILDDSQSQLEKIHQFAWFCGVSGSIGTWHSAPENTTDFRAPSRTHKPIAPPRYGMRRNAMLPACYFIHVLRPLQCILTR